jgi:hypothetical protein
VVAEAMLEVAEVNDDEVEIADVEVAAQESLAQRGAK